MDTTGIKELNWDERATWGECPICHAPNGEYCYSEVGIPIGRNANGQPPERGVHLGRLQKAPTKIKVIRVD